MQDKITKTVFAANAVLAFAALLGWFDHSVIPKIPRESAADITAVLILIVGAIFCGMMYRGGKDQAPKIKKVADLCWNAWTYFGVYILARVSINGGINLEGTFHGMPAGLLTVVVIGLLLNAMVRVALGVLDLTGYK